MGRDQKFDVVIKRVLSSADEMLRQLGISNVVERLSPEFPRIRNLRCDLLLKTAEGELNQVELQAKNELNMPLRMLDYAVAGLHCYGCCPRQIVLYVGKEPMRMQSSLVAAGIDFRFELLDIRKLDRDALLRSDNVADNLIAILAGNREDGAIGHILGKLKRLNSEQRAEAVRALLVLSGLRGWEDQIEEEVQRMPLNIDIMENKVLGPAIRRGIEQGLKQGLEKGLEKGREEGLQAGAQDLLRFLIEKRFGPIPGWANRKLRKLSRVRTQQLAEAILKAKTLEELLG